MIFGEINLLTWLCLFIVYFIYDIVYIKYILYVANLNAAYSAHSGVLLYILTAYGTVQYIANLWNIIPIVIASWLGTYLTIRYERNCKRKKLLKKKTDNTKLNENSKM
jgi:hypothetical protein